MEKKTYEDGFKQALDILSFMQKNPDLSIEEIAESLDCTKEEIKKVKQVLVPRYTIQEFYKMYVLATNDIFGTALYFDDPSDSFYIMARRCGMGKAIAAQMFGVTGEAMEDLEKIV